MGAETTVWGMMVGNWISLFGIVVGAAAFLSGRRQYVMAQKWKRAEHVAAETKAFFDHVDVVNTFYMLDWNSRQFTLPDGSVTQIDDDIITRALRYHTVDGSFTPTEEFIRLTFDSFLGALERFECFIEVGLISSHDVRPYLKYWINVIGNKRSGRKDEAFYDAFWGYIDAYGYTGAQSFLKRFGHDITPAQTPAAP
jgi:hypothetical protein